MVFGMKSWSDLSWYEKCRIQDGSVNPYSYSSGYSFQVKQEVADGQRNQEAQKEESDER